MTGNWKTDHLALLVQQAQGAVDDLAGVDESHECGCGCGEWVTPSETSPMVRKLRAAEERLEEASTELAEWLHILELDGELSAVAA